MGLFASVVGRVRETVGESLEAGRFVKKHKLIRDKEVKDRYYLSQARDRWIDADLTDPDVREKIEIAIREFRTKIVIQKKKKEKSKEKERDRDGDALFNVDEAHRMFALGREDVEGMPSLSGKNPGRKVRRGL
jgi:hypothetical protein